MTLKDIITELRIIAANKGLTAHELKDRLLLLADELEKRCWVQTSDRLPEKIGHYLVIKRQKTGQMQMAFAHWDSKIWSGNGNYSDVLAWMSLPEKDD